MAKSYWTRNSRSPGVFCISHYFVTTLRYIYFIYTRRKAKGATAGRPFGRPSCENARGQTTQVLVACLPYAVSPRALSSCRARVHYIEGGTKRGGKEELI